MRRLTESPVVDRRGAAAHRAGSPTDSVARYLEEIGRHPLLTPEAEEELAGRIRAGQEAAEALAASTRRSPAERRRLQHLVVDGRAAHRAFVNANLRLVVSVAKGYQATGVPLLDLIQDGNLGLMHAVDKFDHEKGFRFSTYAVWWIRQAISRGVAGSRSVIRLPTRAHDELLRIRQAERDLETELARPATLDEVATRAGLTTDRVVDLRSSAEVASLSTPVGSESATEVGDLVEDARARSEVEAVADRLSGQEIDDVLSVLEPRERRTILLRYGFEGGEPLSVREVAQDLGLSRERVRQLERRAIAKLIHPSRRRMAHHLLP